MLVELLENFEVFHSRADAQNVNLIQPTEGAKCGKPFCAECLTMTSAGRMLCLPCLAAEQAKAEEPMAAVEARCEAEAPAAVIPPVEAETKHDAAENAVEVAPVESEAAEAHEKSDEEEKPEKPKFYQELFTWILWHVSAIYIIDWIGMLIPYIDDYIVQRPKMMHYHPSQEDYMRVFSVVIYVAIATIIVILTCKWIVSRLFGNDDSTIMTQDFLRTCALALLVPLKKWEISAIAQTKNYISMYSHDEMIRTNVFMIIQIVLSLAVFVEMLVAVARESAEKKKNV